MTKNLQEIWAEWQDYNSEEYASSNGEKGLSPKAIEVQKIFKQKLNKGKRGRKKKSELNDNDYEKSSVDFSKNMHYLHLKNILLSLTDKIVYEDFSKTGELKVPLFSRVLAKYYSNSRANYLLAKGPKREALRKDYNAYGTTVRSAYKTIIKNVEKFSQEPVNIVVTKELENQLRELFPKKELINIFMATWLQNHTSFTKNQTAESIKSLIFIFPVLAFFTGDETRSLAVGVKEIIEKRGIEVLKHYSIIQEAFNENIERAKRRAK